MSMYLEYQRDGKWHTADTSDPEGWWIMKLEEVIKPPTEGIPLLEMTDDDLGLVSFKNTDAPVIRQYLTDKGAAYRDGMQGFLEFLEESQQPVIARWRD